MTNQKIPKPFTLASNLVLIAFVLSIVYQLLPNIHVMAGLLWFNVIMKGLLLGLAILLRFGYRWTKYLLILFAVFSLLGIHDVLDIFSYPRWSSALTVAQMALMVSAAVVVLREKEK